MIVLSNYSEKFNFYNINENNNIYLADFEFIYNSVIIENIVISNKNIQSNNDNNDNNDYFDINSELIQVHKTDYGDLPISLIKILQDSEVC
jgi:hypothetical protein